MTSISPIGAHSYNAPSITHPSQIVISEDLKRAALDHLSYIKEYYDHPEYEQKQAREHALFRYENFWLPLLVESGDLEIVPPLDVMFVWHAHMLAPTAYASDCERLFGRILPFRVRPRLQQTIKFSEQLWTKKYNRTMPYHLDYTTHIPATPPYTSKIKYALAQAVERQIDFYYNVSFGHFKESEFLDEAIKRYKKFLFLKRLNPQLYIVPMYDIDLIWHTHQLFPDIYRRDMLTNLQHVLHHDDTTNDRSPNSKLTTSDSETRHKWFELYGDRLPKNGCMYRGKTSRGFYQPIADFKFLLECQRYVMYVQLIETNAPAAGSTGRDADQHTSTVVPLHDHALGERIREQFFAQFNLSEQEIFARGASRHLEAHFDADFSDFSTNLVLKIQRKSGYWPMNYYSTIEEFSIPSDKLIPIIQYSGPIKPTDKFVDDNEPSALYYIYETAITSKSPLREVMPNIKRLAIGVPTLDINSIGVRFCISEYSNVTLDRNYLTKLGTTFLFNLENVEVQQAVHDICPLHQDDPVLVNIIHTVINDIDIFTATFNDSIFASCHTLNWSQLPLPNQVSEKHDISAITLNPENEEALIIKDYRGDWGIVKFSKNILSVSEGPLANGGSSPFSLYRFMPDGCVVEELVFVDYDQEKYVISCNTFSIDINTSAISIQRTETKNAMQYICLGSAIISRFSKLLDNQLQANGEENQLASKTKTSATNGNHSDSDLLANDIGKINMNGSNGFNSTTHASINKRPQIGMSNV